MQRFQCLAHLHGRKPCHQHGEEFLQCHRFAHDRQPEEQRLLQGRESCKLLGKQVTDGAKDHRVLLQEGADLAPEEFGDGLSDDVQGQRVARIQLGEAHPVLRGANDIPFL